MYYSSLTRSTNITTHYDSIGCDPVENNIEPHKRYSKSAQGNTRRYRYNNCVLCQIIQVDEKHNQRDCHCHCRDVTPVLHKSIYIPLVMVVQKSELQYFYFLCERKKQQFVKIDLPPHTSPHKCFIYFYISSLIGHIIVCRCIVVVAMLTDLTMEAEVMRGRQW